MNYTSTSQTPVSHTSDSAALEAYRTVIERVSFELESGPTSVRIEEILNATVLTGGKRFRPTLVVLFGSLFGLDADLLAPYARAAELTHAATLAHDDVIDNAQERRNLKTLNVVKSNSHAVLGGDFLLSRVIAEIASLGELAVVQDMARVLEALVSGEWLQLDSRGQVDRSVTSLEQGSARKTASLIEWCCATPARLAGFNEPIVALAREFGTALGLAFQRVDDVLDFEEGTGKPFAQDFREGLMNFVTHEILKQHPDRFAAFERTLGHAGEGGEWPWTDEELETAREAVRQQARKQGDRAIQILDRIVERLSAEGFRIEARGYDGLKEVVEAVVSRNY